ncbi:hypothetical protein WN73_00080 [Bradyrhizobium sp. CCBAU 45394]|nr:hypothetical protein [Bradyrhizobium sp. CCBAU 45394]MDA9535554.1 hypothetical protein [Bradyrhizobium sp. CCBAU 21362]
MSVNDIHKEAAPPLPLAGEGWGGGVSAGESPQEERALTRRYAIAEAAPRRSKWTAAEGGLCLSRKRERLEKQLEPRP